MKLPIRETYLIDIKNKPRVIQLVKIGFYVNIESLLYTFYFTITQFAYDAFFVGALEE
ncbi:hypothetical protein [Bacillus inaquosorum]|uniref:hypothetical protein n=1 Tax=Bacillus inaquosorum TaxID=483913 RepID=UPI00227EE8CA|nr:hypothetical protein [Bacillus inaquosorum]MCY8996892.1 hypothetical protein [Bacillus inaquosorum]MCY9014539.1 hypothetical protein [Bacillus inaquosorum]MCY9043274.1 hypothetical protein [Bacillus inaquosorum]MCY9105332.1 hypothetical protein [Bacillus inaquosorum]MCY9121995.1 hypothetical protein [Bacillus inaquosorum]